MTLHRRNLLLDGVSAMGFLAAPIWIRTAFAGEPPCIRSLRGLVSLGSAFRRAHESGKRLLVLVIPESDLDKLERGQLFGAWLNHTTDAGLAPLTLCELACATMADLRNLVPSAPPGEPLMVLVDPSALGRVPVAIDPPVPPRYQRALPASDESKDWKRLMREQEDRENAAWDARISVISRAVRGAVAPGVRFADEASAAGRARDRWVKVRVPGSHWASSDGCGTTIEDLDLDPDSKYMVACGMGHVPEKAQRFLYLFVKDPDTNKDLPP